MFKFNENKLSGNCFQNNTGKSFPDLSSKIGMLMCNSNLIQKS